MDVKIAAMFGGVGTHRAFEHFAVGIPRDVVVAMNGVADDWERLSPTGVVVVVVAGAVFAATRTTTSAHIGGEIASHVVSSVGKQMRNGSGRPIQCGGGGGSGGGCGQCAGSGRQLRVRIEVHPRQRGAIQTHAIIAFLLLRGKYGIEVT